MFKLIKQLIYFSCMYSNSHDYILIFIWSTVILVSRLPKDKLLEHTYNLVSGKKFQIEMTLTSFYTTLPVLPQTQNCTIHPGMNL